MQFASELLGSGRGRTGMGVDSDAPTPTPQCQRSRGCVCAAVMSLPKRFVGRGGGWGVLSQDGLMTPKNCSSSYGGTL